MAINEAQSFKTLADNIWKYIELKISDKTANNISFFRAQVTANPGDGTLTVQRPLDNAITIPCTSQMSGAAVGDQVIVLVFGTMSGNNAIVVDDGGYTTAGAAALADDISAIQTDVSTAQGNIATIQSDITTLQGQTERMVTTENSYDTASIGTANSLSTPQRIRVWAEDTSGTEGRYGLLVLDTGISLYKSGSGTVWSFSVTPTSLSKTYTSNSYVTSAGFSSGFTPYSKMGMLSVGINLNIATAIPNNTTNVQIGTISGWNAAFAANVSMAGRSGSSVGNLVLAISQTGVITIGNASGTACSGQYRTVITVPAA